ncbi:hypothetical protein K504DRAFT_159633 [Pleomassaria siparia CBS 279.74]|uniref:BTB domain-containing protein n=1 Tax=Pleomassaria siparia CBS 279.74 TaxID=1314801 RepID=A0A6G1JU91_9PLEO|nr:hypothetical protein K504DRAFT_159633 [Pleomassaria siparia CBS 279.74]
MANADFLLGSLGDSTIKLVVGEGDEQKNFTVHENIICARSSFFRTCMNGDWKEFEDRVVKLPEDNPEAVELYIQSLYTGNISQTEEISSSSHFYVTLGDAYVLADKFMDVYARNVVVEAIFNKVTKSIFTEGNAPCADVATMISNIWPVLGPDLNRITIRSFLLKIFMCYSMLDHSFNENVDDFVAFLDGIPADYSSSCLYMIKIRDPKILLPYPKLDQLLTKDPEAKDKGGANT